MHAVEALRWFFAEPLLSENNRLSAIFPVDHALHKKVITMEINEIHDIMDCLPKGRTKFYYFKDRYALMLLAYVVGNGRRIREIKSSRFGRLVQKPIVEKIIENSGVNPDIRVNKLTDDQIAKLKREIEVLNWPVYKELALRRCTGTVKYSGLDRMHEIRKRGVSGRGAR